MVIFELVELEVKKGHCKPIHTKIPTFFGPKINPGYFGLDYKYTVPRITFLSLKLLNKLVVNEKLHVLGQSIPS